MRGIHNSSFNPQTLAVLEVAFDEAWLTLKAIGNKTVKPDELARAVLRRAMEGERDPVRLHAGTLTDRCPTAGARRAHRRALLPAMILADEAGGRFLDRLWRRKATFRF